MADEKKEMPLPDETALQLTKEGAEIEFGDDEKQHTAYARRLDRPDEIDLEHLVWAEAARYEREGHSREVAAEMAAYSGSIYLIFKTAMKADKHDERYFETINDVKELSLETRADYQIKYNDKLALPSEQELKNSQRETTP